MNRARRPLPFLRIGGLLGTIGGISALFLVAMLTEKAEGSLQSVAVGQMASAHVAALVLTPFVLTIATIVMLVARVVFGNTMFLRIGWIRIGRAASGVVFWLLIVLAISYVLERFWTLPQT